MKASQYLSLSKEIIKLIRPHYNLYIQVIFSSLIFTIIGLFTSVYIQKVTDVLITKKDTSVLSIISLLMLMLIFLQFSLAFLKDRILLRIGQVIDGKLILGYLHNVLEHTTVFFAENKSGEVISKINDAVKIRNFVTQILISIISNIFILIISFTFLVSYYWKLASVIFSIIPLYVLIYFLSHSFNKNTERKIMEDAANFREEIISSLNNIKTIKLLNIERYYYNKIENSFIPFIQTSYKSAINNLIIQYLNTIISQVFIILLLWIGAVFVIQENLSLGELFSCFFILNFFLSPLQALVNTDVHIQNAYISADRLFKEIKVGEEKEFVKLSDNNSDNLIFKNVSFRYEKNGKTILNKLNFEIEYNSITAITGKSGAGKSTLINLILKYIKPIDGVISLGNKNLEIINTSSLRNHISIITQEVEIFNGSLVDNIHLDLNREIDIALINQLIEKLDLTSFVNSLPDGINENIGVKGMKMSGGQKQRISIARVLYRNPKIIVFDEATSSLDNFTLNLINNLIIDLKKEGKTIIIVAHRFESIVIADRTIVINDGIVEDIGNHNYLRVKNKFYKETFG